MLGDENFRKFSLSLTVIVLSKAASAISHLYEILNVFRV